MSLYTEMPREIAHAQPTKKKDLFIVKDQVSLIYLLPLVIIIATSLSNPAFLYPLLAMIVPLAFVFLAVSTMHEDEISDWGTYERALPLSLEVIVGAKYLLSIVAIGSAAVALAVVGLVLAQFIPLDLFVANIFVFAGLAVARIYVALVIPILYRYGSMKGSFTFVAVILALTFIPFMTSKFDSESLIRTLLNYGVLSPVVISIALVVLLVVSFFVSRHIRRFRW